MHARSTDARPPRRAAHLAEAASYALAVAIVWILGRFAAAAFVARAAELGADVVPEAAEVEAIARRAAALFTAGIVALAAGRHASLRRSRDPLFAGLALPATLGAALLGFAVHLGTVDTVVRGADGSRATVVLPPSAATFAEGFALGALLAAVVLASPLDLAAFAQRARHAVAATIALVFVALAVAGTGPGASGVRINLGPVQPIEGVKVLFVIFLASHLGARASKLRWQRERILGLRWPRLTLLVPAVLVLLGIFAGLFLVGDLGPVLLLAVVFLGTFYLVTRASGWAALSIAIVVALLAVAASFPDVVRVGRVATRIRMWRDPWWNDAPHGDQLGESLWAIAAGGPFGQGLGAAHAPLVPAGKTDLVLATLAEQLGAAGVIAYVACVAAIAGTGLAVAARSRTPERLLLAAGAALALVAQWALIHAGTFGLFPLTGVVVPFLSSGRSSMVAFLVLVALVVRVAEDGPARARSDELDELRGGVRRVAIAVGLAFAVLGGAAIDVGVVDRARIRAMGLATRLRDGSSVIRNDPRLLAIAGSLRRGAILDRNGVAIASSATAEGPRAFPLGDSMGTLLGAHPSRVLLPPWAIERTHDARLRGYGTRSDGPLERPWRDLRAFAPLLELPRDERAARVRALDADVAARSVHLTIDARLQRDVAAALAGAVARGRGLAAAAVVVDVDTGDVLARAQVPDFDPGDDAWQERVRDERFTGAYGPWPDKTGMQGVFQSGSVGKLFTALAAARAGTHVGGVACGADSMTRYDCVERDARGPFFTRPGWTQPVHDHPRDPVHGRIGLVEALAVSCNVYFGQLALALGPEPLVALREAGVDVGFGPALPFRPGAPGSRQLASTGFGQGALAMNVLQAARLVAAIGAAGAYRACPASMELGATCEERRVVDDPRALAPILAGMRRVMTAGTGRGLDVPGGVRVYGKTGTADVRGFAGEAPFGIAPGAGAAPHSWFVALAEPDDAPECALAAPGRLAVAVVVPRGGSGASAAGPAAMEIVARARALGYLGGAR